MEGPERRQSASVGSSNLKDGPAGESEARAEEKPEGSAGGGRQPGNRQSGRKVRLKGRSQSASRVARQEGRAGNSSRGRKPIGGAEGKAERLANRRKPKTRAGGQIRKRSSRRKLMNGAEGEAERLEEGASRTAAAKQNRRFNRRRKLTERSKERPEGRS